MAPMPDFDDAPETSVYLACRKLVDEIDNPAGRLLDTMKAYSCLVRSLAKAEASTHG